MWPFKPTQQPDAFEEHHIVMPGLEISFNHATRTVFVIDQTGSVDTVALSELEDWYKSKGWFMHAVMVEPPKTETDKRQ